MSLLASVCKPGSTLLCMCSGLGEKYKADFILVDAGPSNDELNRVGCSILESHGFLTLSNSIGHDAQL